MYITNDGREQPDQRLIETLPPPAPEITHAERENYVIEDEFMRFQYPALLGETAPPALTELDDELRGCSPGFVAGFMDQPLPKDADIEFRSEYIRGELERFKQN
jgi:hypothetical protein